MIQHFALRTECWITCYLLPSEDNMHQHLNKRTYIYNVFTLTEQAFSQQKVTASLSYCCKPNSVRKRKFFFCVCFPLVYSKWVLTDFWSWEHIFWKAFLTLVCWINPAAIFRWSFLINTCCCLFSSASCVQRLFLRGD